MPENRENFTPAAELGQRLEVLRAALRAENISWGELHELQSLAPWIDPGDAELLEAAGVPESTYCAQFSPDAAAEGSRPVPATKIVWLNGYAFRVPADELTDPNPPAGGAWCGAYDQGTGATCTLAPHETDAAAGTVHIAHDGERNVIAVWGAIAVITDADTEGN